MFRSGNQKGKRIAILMFAVALSCMSIAATAQNLGTAPQTGKAVLGETAAQPEGTFLNVVNWVSNVICPIGTGLGVVGAIVAWFSGRGFGKWIAGAGGLLGVSALLRLIESFITNGTAGVAELATKVSGLS